MLIIGMKLLCFHCFSTSISCNFHNFVGVLHLSICLLQLGKLAEARILLLQLLSACRNHLFTVALHLTKMAKLCTIIIDQKRCLCSVCTTAGDYTHCKLLYIRSSVSNRARTHKFYWKFSSRKYLILQLVLWYLLNMSQSGLGSAYSKLFESFKIMPFFHFQTQWFQIITFHPSWSDLYVLVVLQTAVFQPGTLPARY